MMSMIIAIGNSPSSGSTLLGDLLDSLPFAVCGPEMHLFSVRDHFADYEVAQEKILASSACSSCYCSRVKFVLSRLYSYGLDEKIIKRFLAQESSFQEFCKRFFEHFAALRGKHTSLAFEKTPQNIHGAKLFLDAFPDSIFLHVVRNPLYVYKSLRKRGFPPYIAAATWLVDVAAAYELRTHPRFRTIRYEDLVQRPYRTVVEFAGSLGEDAKEESLERLYKENKYRALYSGKISSWSVKRYGEIDNANRGEITSKDVAALKYMVESRVGDGYSRLFGLPQVSFAQVSEFYGYEFDDVLDSSHVGPSWPDRESKFRLLRKWYRDLLKSDARLGDVSSYLNPVMSI